VFEAQCRQMMQQQLAETVPVKHGALALLSALQARHIPIAVATSSRSPHAYGQLGRAGLLDLFETIVTRDDVVNPKPHPEPYLTAAQRLGVAPARCLALEDSHSGVRAAHAAGLQTIMVPDLVRPTEEIAGLCIAVLASLAEVQELALPPLAASAG
jgi:HAD superfamily hydrolase (TIGR01509 family)